MERLFIKYLWLRLIGSRPGCIDPWSGASINFSVSQPPPFSIVVVVPAYNPGPVLESTLRGILTGGWRTVLVDDGCTDGTADLVRRLAAEFTGLLRMENHAVNEGKGAAVITGVRAAQAWGASHAVLFDADGQHPAEEIAGYAAIGEKNPSAMVCGVPQFGAEAPWERRLCRRLANGGLALLTRGKGPQDVLFGMRCVPCAALMECMLSTRQGRKYDFEAESAIQHCRRGYPVINVPVPVRYLTQADGGISHYHYIRDNARLAGLFFRRLIS